MNPIETFVYKSSDPGAKTILLMAGIHPLEEAGVECLVQLITDCNWINRIRPFNLVVLPCRNMFGYSVMETLFNDAGIFVGKPVADADCMQLYELNGDFYVIPRHNPSLDNDRRLESIISCLDDHVIDGFVNILSYTKGANIRANSYYYKNKRLIDMNNIGLAPSHKGIKEIGQLILEYCPDFIIDLHEGKDNNNYVYVTDGAVNLGRAIINEYVNRGMAIRESAEDRIAIDRGVYAFEALNCYKSWKSYLTDSEVIIIEGGSNGDSAHRVECLKSGIEACLQFIETSVEEKDCNTRKND